MAIQDILNALETQAQLDMDAVVAEAQEHAALIVSEAEGEAERVRQGYVRQVEKGASRDASKLVNAARLEAKMTASSARGRGLEGAFVAASKLLAEARADSGYDDLFAKLAVEALADANGEVVIHVDPADADRAARAASKAGVTAKVETDISTAGGLVVEANGGHIVRRNTLEDRLERVRQYVQSDVAEVLFA